MWLPIHGPVDIFRTQEYFDCIGELQMQFSYQLIIKDME